MMERKQLLVISENLELINCIKEKVSHTYEVVVEKSIHAGYNIALNVLPDIIFIDNVSGELDGIKNLSNFKSTHFLKNCWLMLYVRESDFSKIQFKYIEVVDEFLHNAMAKSLICESIVKRSFSNSCSVNYWRDCFLGLFNLNLKPVLLLQQNSIIEMNDAFKKTFRIDNCNGLKLTDLVNVENKNKVKATLRTFARGKHLQAITKTTLLLKNEKLRNARISFSKLSRNIPDQFIMVIDFSGKATNFTPSVGTNSSLVEDCFEATSSLAEFEFSKREKEIIELLCKGYKTKEISEALFISPKTIEKHRSNIIKRTNSETILESIIYAINHKLVAAPMS